MIFTEQIIIGPGTYRIYFSDPNRNADIVNIPSSVNIPFCIETSLAILPLNCPVTPLQFQGMPFFRAQVNRPFRHNMTILDHDNDSLSFGLITPLMANNTPVPGYSIPVGLTIGAVSGLISWNTTISAGVGDYVVAVRISKWRDGYYLGYVVRDFQVSLVSIFTDTLNVFAPLSLAQDAQGNYFVSVNPGDTVNVHAVYYGSGSSFVSGYGEAFYLSNQPTLQTVSASGTTTADLTLVPNAMQARPHPYIFTLRGSSNSAAPIGLRQTDATFLVYVNGASTDSCTGPIGFNELEGTADKITIFPNPATNQLTIDNGELKIKNVEIYSALGEKVFESQLSIVNYQLSIIN